MQRELFSKEHWSESYQSWANAGNAWNRILGLGGTDTQSALTWYQWYRGKPNKEWRPSIIVKALVEAIKEWDETTTWQIRSSQAL